MAAGGRAAARPRAASLPAAAAVERAALTTPLALLFLAALAALSVVTAGCGEGPQARAPRQADSGAHSAAMDPRTQLDPPALADQPAAIAADGGVPVLCYHYFRGRFSPGYALRVFGAVVLGLPALGPREFWTTPVAEFERHLRALKAAGYTVVTLDDLADDVAAGRPLPPRAVVLTIDDADESVYRHAFPLLRRYGVPAHVFVPTGHVGRRWSGLRVCSADHLREMQASGLVRLESHTHDLHRKGLDGDQVVPVFLHPERWQRIRETGGDPVRADLVASRRAVAALAGPRRAWLAWPYGFATAELDSLARACGFRGTVSLKPRPFGPADSGLSVGRFAVTAHTTTAGVAALVAPAAPAAGPDSAGTGAGGGS